MTIATKEEPKPTPNSNHCLWSYVIDDTWNLTPDGAWCAPLLHEAVRKDMHARREMGVLKYGTHLQAYNGRNPLVDAYQESLDIVVYLKQACEEEYPVKHIYQRALTDVFELKSVLLSLGL